ncbi:MAG: hypothetical protein ACJ8CB_31130 [Ktedonobacteraceae bacterium]
MPHKEQGDDEQDAYRANLESALGPLARYTDHKIGETIRYRFFDDNGRETIRQGEIIWASQGEEGSQLTYYVTRGLSEGFPDFVSPHNIIETET